MNCRNIWARAQGMLLERLRLNVPMKNHTTMGVGGAARVMAQPDSLDELEAVLKVCADNDLPYYLMGAGSNLLFSDEGFDGVVIKLGPAFKRLEFESPALIRAGAAAPVGRALDLAVENSLSGLECLAGIPGTIGGAAYMNAGSFGRSVGQVVAAISFVTASGEKGRAEAKDLGFSYRRLTGLPEGAIITEVELALSRAPEAEIKAAVKSNLETRAARHPHGVRSAGSVFKNPADIPAGRLIEECGFKGLKIGGAEVSELHGNFIINPEGAAQSRDVLALIERIVKTVRETRGVILEPEIKIIGPRGEVSSHEKR